MPLGDDIKFVLNNTLVLVVPSNSDNNGYF